VVFSSINRYTELIWTHCLASGGETYELTLEPCSCLPSVSLFPPACLSLAANLSPFTTPDYLRRPTSGRITERFLLHHAALKRNDRPPPSVIPLSKIIYQVS
jgi:hypothetical protein